MKSMIPLDMDMKVGEIFHQELKTNLLRMNTSQTQVDTRYRYIYVFDDEDEYDPEYNLIWKSLASSPQVQVPITFDPNTIFQNSLTMHHRTFGSNVIQQILEKYDILNEDPDNWVGFIETKYNNQQRGTVRKEIKHALRQYDTDFNTIFGFMPSKLHKECLRPLFSLYRALNRKTNQDPRSVDKAVRPCDNLMTEKKTLRSKLMDYSKNFHEEQGRQISTYSDILPIKADYKRYIEVKAELKKLQS